MIDSLTSIGIITTICSLIFLILGILNITKPVYKLLFILTSLWLMFLSLNIARQGLSVTETNVITKNVYNISGIMTSQENSTITNSLSNTTNVTDLMDTFNFIWTIVTILVSGLEIIWLAIWGIIVMGDYGREPPIDFKPF